MIFIFKGFLLLKTRMRKEYGGEKMELLWVFLMNSMLLGVGLAADAFSVSVVDGIHYPNMKYAKVVKIAGLFAFFQALMPMIGWFLTNTIMDYFHILQKFLPWISQIFLFGLGMNMIMERKKDNSLDTEAKRLTKKELLIQAIATSIDALLVGVTIVAYPFLKAVFCAAIIAGVTFVVCFLGVHWGKQVGVRLAGKASFFGGIVLILIALENFSRTIVF